MPRVGKQTSVPCNKSNRALKGRKTVSCPEFTKTDSGGTDFVWFYDVKADGLSLDDKRSPLLSEVDSPH